MEVSLYITTLKDDYYPTFYVHYRNAISRGTFYGKVYRISTNTEAKEGFLSVNISALYGFKVWGFGINDDPSNFLSKSSDKEELPAFYKTKRRVCKLSTNLTGWESPKDGGRLKEILEEQIRGGKTPEEMVKNVKAEIKSESSPGCCSRCCCM